MNLIVKLTELEQNRLGVITAAMQSVSPSDAVRTLINEKFETIQAAKTLVERRGGHPQYLLNGGADLSERANRKSAIAKRLTAKPLRKFR